MPGKRILVAVLAVMTVLSASVLAQDDGKNEIGVAFGRVLVSDQGIKGANYFDPIIHHGAGMSIEGSYARRLLVTGVYSFAFEVPAMYNFKTKLNAGAYPNAVVPLDYKSYFITPAIRANLFPTTAVSPWVSLGAGFGHFSENNTLLFGGANPGKAKTGAVIEGGIGVDVKVWKSLRIRGEVRDFYSQEPDYPLAPTGKSRQHNYFGGGGVMWRF